MTAALAPWREKLRGREIATVYFGGGTPSLLGTRRLGAILDAVREGFSLAPGAEITLEANPTHVDRAFFQEACRAGFNRLSMGLQSANGEELRFLGRAHSPQQAALAVENARAGGFENISLDLMLGLPGGSREKLGRSIAFAASLGVEHISSYILKVEPGTPFAARGVQVAMGSMRSATLPAPARRAATTCCTGGEEYLGFGPGPTPFLRGGGFTIPGTWRASSREIPPQRTARAGTLESSPC